MHAKTKTCATILAVAVVLCAVGQVLARPTTQPAGAPTTRPGKLYSIQFDRPEKVGQKFRFVAKSRTKEMTTVTPGDEPPQIQQVSFEVRALCEVLATDANGLPTKLAFTVDRCVRIQDGNQTEPIAKGTVVICSGANGRTDFRCKDPNAAFSADALNVLQRCMSVGSAAPDASIGSLGFDKPRRLGESWKLDSNSLARQFNEQNPNTFKLKDKDVSGRAELVGLTKVSGVACLNLRMRMSCRNFLQMPAGVVVPKKSRMSFTSECKLPVDETLPMLKVALSSKSTYVLKNVFSSDNAETKAVATSKTTIRLTPMNK